MNNVKKCLVAFLFICALSPAVSAQTPDGLVSCWPGDGNANDVIAGNNGDLLGEPAPTFVGGALNDAFRFTGLVDEQVKVNNNNALEPTAVSVSLWMRSTGPTGARYLLAKGANGCASASYAFYLSGGLRFYVTTDPGSFVLSPADNTVFDGTWHHAVGTYSPADGKVRLYVDGSQVGSGGSAGNQIDYTRMPSSSDLHFGEWPTGCVPEYVGDIDEIQIYNVVLTGDEVAGLYNGGTPLACDPTINVLIDIKPGSDPNCFNINGHGVIPVAILGSDTFDVRDVDVGTLIFGSLAVRVRGNKGALCGFEDVNDDGLEDLVCQFEDDPGFWNPNGDGTATLGGALLDGTPFEGTDSICTRP